MNKLQNFRLMMYYSVISISTAKKVLWDGNVPFALSFDLFTQKVQLIQSFSKMQTAEIIGTTSAKNEKKKELISLILFFEQRLKSFASANNNIGLYDSLGFNSTRLKYMHDSNLPVVAGTLIQLADEYYDPLTSYGITGEWLTNFKNIAENFSSELLKPRNAIMQKKLATEALSALFKEADTILRDRLDNDIIVFKADNPDFFNQYFMARIIADKGHRRITVKGSAIIEGSSEPVKNASFLFTKTGENMVIIEKKTSDKGHFLVRSLPDGDYLVKVSKVGFKEQTVKITIANGEMVNLNVKMEAA